MAPPLLGQGGPVLPFWPGGPGGPCTPSLPRRSSTNTLLLLFSDICRLVCPTDSVRNWIVSHINRFSCVLVEDAEVDTFWNCDAADEEQKDNGCVAHLADSCWRKLVVSCNVSNEVTCARSLSFYTALMHVSWSACVHSVPSDLCNVTGSLNCLLVVKVHTYILNQVPYTVWHYTICILYLMCQFKYTCMYSTCCYKNLMKECFNDIIVYSVTHWKLCRCGLVTIHEY